MASNIKLSVITINFNNKIGLEKTILSVITQDLKLEYIIIDGNSTDGSKLLLEKYYDYIDVGISEADNGIYSAMNKGIKHATGEWLIFMNSGDEFNSSSILTEIFVNNNYSNKYNCIIGDTLLMDLKNRIVKVQKANLFQRRFIHQSVLYRRILHLKYGLYIDEKYFTASDYFFITKIINNESTYKLNKIISNYQVGGVSDGMKTNVQVLFYDYLSNKISFAKLIVRINMLPIIKILMALKSSLIK